MQTSETKVGHVIQSEAGVSKNGESALRSSFLLAILQSAAACFCLSTDILTHRRISQRNLQICRCSFGKDQHTECCARAAQVANKLAVSK